jgi:hypothetical protein
VLGKREMKPSSSISTTKVCVHRQMCMDGWDVDMGCLCTGITRCLSFERLRSNVQGPALPPSFSAPLPSPVDHVLDVMLYMLFSATCRRCKVCQAW